MKVATFKSRAIFHIMEKKNNAWWDRNFIATVHGERFDYVSRDGSIIIEEINHPQGLRGLYAGIMRLALELDHHPSSRQACIVMNGNSLTIDRIETEFESMQRILNPKIARKIAIIVLLKDRYWVKREDYRLKEIAEHFLSKKQQINKLGNESLTSNKRNKYYEIVKVLLIHWLKKQDSIGIGELAHEVGCTYPTVRSSIKKLESLDYISRQTDRSVELSRFPSTVWKEMLALTSSIRPSISYTDTSGERLSPQRILDRLLRYGPEGIALGGVLAARHWHHKFNLNGIPRVDLILHCPKEKTNLDFVEKLDPALKKSKNKESGVALVIHPLYRAVANYSRDRALELPFADPVEAALDLQEMGLSQQANSLLSQFRPEIRIL